MNSAEPADREPHGNLIELTADECFAMLTNLPIGRVVFIEDGYPTALPVNYRWHDGAVVFRALEGTALHAIPHDSPVSFEVDHWDDHDHTGVSVVIKGTAAEVSDWADKAQLEELGVVPWATDTWRQSWIRITPTHAPTGRRIR